MTTTKEMIAHHLWTVFYGSLHKQPVGPSLDFFRLKALNDDPATIVTNMMNFLSSTAATQAAPVSSAPTKPNGGYEHLRLGTYMVSEDLHELSDHLIPLIDWFWSDHSVKKPWEIDDFLVHNRTNNYVALSLPQQNLVRLCVNEYNRWVDKGCPK